MAKKKTSKNKKSSFLIIIVFLIGVSILLYPMVSNIWNQYRNNKLTVNYDVNVEKISNEKKKKIMEAAISYNRNHTRNTIIDVFSKDCVEFNHKEYKKLLNPCGNGIMGTITIPKIKQQLVCYHGMGDKVLEEGCGHMEGTSLPVGKHGKNGSHTVFAAHRGLPAAKLFTDIDQLKKGDIFFFTIMDKNFAYKVDQIKTVKPGDFRYLKLEKDKDYATLVTCTPYGVNTHRLLVRGHRVPYKEDVAENAKEEVRKDITFKLFLIGALISFILVSLIVLSVKKENSKT